MSLYDIFTKQWNLNKEFIPNIEDKLKTEEGKKELFLKFQLALRQEVTEAVDCVPWKWWKDSTVDINALKEELADILFFWVSMCQSYGFSSHDMMEAYDRKVTINYNRIKKGDKNDTN